ncbi:MAG: IS1182 family transposase [Firmicutes bacterium]|nr:IS1182 family transposase [Bacillota bacterium]
MLSKNTTVQSKVVITTLEALMPQEHFLRDLNNLVDFSFIYKKVAHLYSDVGRPSVDPVVLVKSLLLGFIYGIDSERKIEKEIQVNIAYRWFLGIDLDEHVPDHSTISQTRRRKFNNTNLFEDIFAEVVKKCMEIGLVEGSLILTDSTHVKANASSKRKEFVTIEIEPSEYVKKLDKLCDEEELKIRTDKIERGLKKRGFKADTKLKTKTIAKSTTDPDSGSLSRAGKPEGFHYLSHQSTCGKSGIITDVHVTPANVRDHTPYVERIKHQKEKLELDIKEVGIDKGYDCSEVHSEMLDMGIKTYTPLKDDENKKGRIVFPPSAFVYNPHNDTFTCPNGETLRFVSVDKRTHCKRYSLSRKLCVNCSLKTQCFSGNEHRRRLNIPLMQHKADIQRANYGTMRYYEVQRLRRIYAEGNFALQKDNHNLRKTRKRGIQNVTNHCILSALALNLKRLVKYIKNNPPLLTQIHKAFQKITTALKNRIRNSKLQILFSF